MVADLDALYGHTNGPRRDRQSRKLDAVRWIVGIEQDTDAREVRYRELEKIEPLTNKCVVDEISMFRLNCRQVLQCSAHTLLQPDLREGS